MSVRFTNLRSFERDLQAFTKKIDAAPDTVARMLTFKVFDGVVKKTPVDTGWARANWQVTNGTPATGTTPKPARNNVLPEPTLASLPAGSFPVYWVTNNLPYIVPLENGHSRQMGKGYMVRRTLAAVQSEIRTLLKDL